MNLLNKRGISFGLQNEFPPTQAELKLLADAGVKWFYNWAPEPVVSTGEGLTPWTSGDNGMEFVPMLFRLRSSTARVRALVEASPKGSISHLLVLNEPNHERQAWTTPQDAG